MALSRLQTVAVALERRLAGYGRVSDAVFRFLFAPIFVVGGLGHFIEHDQMLARIAGSPWAEIVARIGDPSLLLHLSGGAFIVFGLFLAAGFMTRLSALVLFATLVPITLSIHLAPGHVGPLLKNVAILGGLLHFAARGGGAFSLDGLRRSGG